MKESNNCFLGGWKIVQIFKMFCKCRGNTTTELKISFKIATGRTVQRKVCLQIFLKINSLMIKSRNSCDNHYIGFVQIFQNVYNLNKRYDIEYGPIGRKYFPLLKLLLRFISVTSSAVQK